MRRQNIFQRGGDKPLSVNANTINLFADPQMEKYMNPIYGLVLCESGFVPNLFHLKLSGIISDPYLEKCANIVGSSCTREGKSTIIRPTNDIMNKVSLVELGRYIAIKYVNMVKGSVDYKISSESSENSKVSSEPSEDTNEYRMDTTNMIAYLNEYKTKYVFGKKFNKITQTQSENIKTCISKLNKKIPIIENDIFAFHIILFCVWWKADTNRGFDDYYRGIEDIFNIVNPYFEKPEQFVFDFSARTRTSASASAHAYASASASASKTFEQLVLNITAVNFKIYNQEQSKHFCEGINYTTYPDCGETVARNIINILCFNGTNFDIGLLQEKGATDELIAYYTVFGNFALQSKTEPSNIFGMQLNARNAWSKLIIDHAQTNLKFKETCHRGSAPSYGYDLLSGLTDGHKPNLLQLLNNLMRDVKTWEDLINDETIIDVDTHKMGHNGIGDIIIKHNSKQDFIVHLLNGHYYVELPIRKEKIDYSHITNSRQRAVIHVLLKKNITKKNYMHIDFSSELLTKEFSSTDDAILKLGLFELSLTSKYDNDTRRRMAIDVDNAPFFNMFATRYGNNEAINKYEFLTRTDFEFVRDLPALKVLKIRDGSFDKSITTIDLSPLQQIEEIGDYFCYNCENLETVNFYDSKDSYLKNLKKVGDFFFGMCDELTEVDLSSLKKLSVIGNHFFAECQNLDTIQFNPAATITSVGHNFLYKNPNLKSVDLRFLENIIFIDTFFLSSCASLTEIIFPKNFRNVMQIENHFMSECENLEHIDLSCFKHLSTIGDDFFAECQQLKTITFNPAAPITSVGHDFLKKCRGIEHIDLRCFKNITEIKSFFMMDCTGIITVQFPDTFVNVTTIGMYFMGNTRNLKQIDLSCFSNVKQIANHFLVASGIEEVSIDFSKLEKIGGDFMLDCSELKTIDLSSLTSIVEVGDYFMHNCSKLREIKLPPDLRLNTEDLINLGLAVDHANQRNAKKMRTEGGSKRRRTTRKIKKNAKKHTRKHR